MELSNLLLAIAAILAVLTFYSVKYGKDYFQICLLGVFIFGFWGAYQISNEKLDERYSNYEKTLATYQYEAYLEDNRVIPAKVCELKNDNKVCEVLEHTYNNGSTEKTIRVGVKDYWEKE